MPSARQPAFPSRSFLAKKMLDTFMECRSLTIAFRHWPNRTNMWAGMWSACATSGAASAYLSF